MDDDQDDEDEDKNCTGCAQVEKRHTEVARALVQELVMGRVRARRNATDSGRKS